VRIDDRRYQLALVAYTALGDEYALRNRERVHAPADGLIDDQETVGDRLGRVNGDNAPIDLALAVQMCWDEGRTRHDFCDAVHLFEKPGIQNGNIVLDYDALDTLNNCGDLRRGRFLRLGLCCCLLDFAHDFLSFL